MNKQTTVLLKKIATKERYPLRRFKQYYYGLSWIDKTKLLNEGRKL